MFLEKKISLKVVFSIVHHWMDGRNVAKSKEVCMN